MEYPNKKAEELHSDGEEGNVLVVSSVLENKEKLKRSIRWLDAFWVSSGVPALVLFSIGAITATVGNPSWF
ncbi:unnamed protein product, partial [Adineta steineri]